ncbi:MAG TPA: hypothetical protein VMW16_06745 [Sedimentisphaerales bacterium]|nr:hypothetical protein [Sedimentisphaerales bacterium]
MSRTLSMLIAVVLFFGLVFILFGKYIVSDNSLEYGRRGCCVINLTKIAKKLTDENLKLKEENIPAIKAVIQELNLHCLSGESIHSDKSASSYQVVVLPGGHVVVTEHPDNHNTDKMKFTDCPYKRYCLYQSTEDANEMQLGRWRNARGGFEEIEAFKSMLKK